MLCEVPEQVVCDDIDRQLPVTESIGCIVDGDQVHPQGLANGHGTEGGPTHLFCTLLLTCVCLCKFKHSNFANGVQSATI